MRGFEPKAPHTWHKDAMYAPRDTNIGLNEGRIHHLIIINSN